MMQQITDLPHLRETLQHWGNAGARIALVPTMGALHAGHMALVDAAKQQADKVVMSIFVNPTQFGPSEDFSRYPRTLEADASLASKHGVDALWIPTVATMYPSGFVTSIHVKSVSEGLCGVFRPEHFDGVATVVCKLLQQVQPHLALFGEKDFQQLAVIRRMVRDLDVPVAIAGVPILREDDGLAMSSRNRYLKDNERVLAASLYAQLQRAAARIAAGEAVHSVCEGASQALLSEGFTRVDYVEYVDDFIARLSAYASNGRLCAAVYLGSTRLIDNVVVGEEELKN